MDRLLCMVLGPYSLHHNGKVHQNDIEETEDSTLYEIGEIIARER